MAERVDNRRLRLRHSQRTLSRRQRLDDGPLDHAVAEPFYVALWLRNQSDTGRVCQASASRSRNARGENTGISPSRARRSLSPDTRAARWVDARTIR
jgi:hypothetical protein